MSELSDPRFTDPSVEPDDESIESIIGKKMDLWKSVLKHAEDNYKDVENINKPVALKVQIK